MLEIVGAIIGGVVSGAFGGWIAGAKSAQRALPSSSAVGPSRQETPLSRVPATAVGPTDDPTTSIDMGDEPSDDSTTSDVEVGVVAERSPAAASADSDSPTAPGPDDAPAPTASVPGEPTPPPLPAMLSIELEEVGRGYFDVLVVNTGEGPAADASVKISKTGSGGYSYLPTDGDTGDLGAIQHDERRRIGQVVRTGGHGLLKIRTTWVDPDGSFGDDEWSFD
jgi:hypothetical protein